MNDHKGANKTYHYTNKNSRNLPQIFEMLFGGAEC